LAKIRAAASRKFPPKGYDSEEQVAAEFGIDPRTLKRWRAQRLGPPVTRLGRRPIYNRESKMRWLKAQELKMRGGGASKARAP
jgi:hypothetical protein